MKHGLLRGALGSLSLVALLGACAMPHEMQQTSPGSTFCLGRGQPRTVDGAVEVEQLRWYRSADARDQTLGAQWCATVGSPVIRLTPAASFPAWTAPGQLDVATWNMQIGGGDLFRFLETELGLDCADSGPTFDSRARPFVVLLQEVYRFSADLPVVESSESIPLTIDHHGERPGEEPDIVEVAQRCGLSFVYVPSARNGPDSGTRPHEDKGNAILATLPLTDPLALDLPYEGGRKVAVAATVRAPDGAALRVVSAHLDVASTLFRTLISGNQTRARQVSGLIDSLDRAQRDGLRVAATVVGGDLNTWAGNETTVKLMRRHFPESPAWDGLGTRGSFPPDHMFFRRGAGVPLAIEGYRRIENAYHSDHNGRRLTVRYEAVGSIR